MGNLFKEIKTEFENSNLFESGTKIIGSLIDGIKAKVMETVNAVREMAGNIRKLLPFSPAKEGPLKDLNRIRLIETIAEGLKPGILVERVKNGLGALAG